MNSNEEQSLNDPLNEDSIAQEAVVSDPRYVALHSWIAANPAEWARVVCMLLSGTSALKCASSLKEKMVAHLRRIQPVRGLEVAMTDEREALTQIINLHDIEIASVIYLLVHVTYVPPALLAAMAEVVSQPTAPYKVF